MRNYEYVKINNTSQQRSRKPHQGNNRYKNSEMQVLCLRNPIMKIKNQVDRLSGRREMTGGTTTGRKGREAGII